MPLVADAPIRKILEVTRVIALVGASEKPWRDSHSVMQYLLSRGYTVIPVNPNAREVLGVPCYPDLETIPSKIDLVNVFRKSEAVIGIVEEAIRLGVPAIWMQLGVVDEKAAFLAEDKGLAVVMNRCIAVEHRRLVG
jgi:hypothetical protein